MPSLRGGGAERTLINLLNKVDYNRFDVDLVVVSEHGPYISQIPPEVSVSYLFKNHFLVRILAYLHRTHDINWFFRKKMEAFTKEYDVGISFLDSNFTDLLFYSDNFKRRVAFIHGSYLSHSNYERFYKFKKYRSKLHKNRYSQLDGIYFVSNDSKTEFEELFGEYPGMGVVYNMIDCETVIEKSAENDRPRAKDIFTFSAVGSLLPIKGFDRLVRASKIARDKGYAFRVEIAGTGPEEENLKRLIRECDIEETVTLRGFVDNPYPLMSRSDVFVMTSISEALPTVLCEAMALGVPALVTDCSGCRGLVDDEFGIVAKQDDKDFAKKMMTLMDRPDLLAHYREKSLERSEIFDDEAVLQAYYNIFDGKDPEGPGVSSRQVNENNG